MKYLIIVLALTGCSMDYDIVQELSKYCTDRGLEARIIHGFGHAHRVTCYDKRTDTFYKPK